jgi:hypothetical protein
MVPGLGNLCRSSLNVLSTAAATAAAAAAAAGRAVALTALAR